MVHGIYSMIDGILSGSVECWYHGTEREITFSRPEGREKTALAEQEDMR